MSKVAELYKQAFDEAIKTIEQYAREIMTENPKYKEFVMAMGSYFFIDKKGNNVEVMDSEYINYAYKYFDSDPSFKKLNDFIGEWDQYLKITGTPMRFTATGKVVTDW